MRCPNCGKWMKVVNSKSDGKVRYRKRKCDWCGTSICTEEKQIAYAAGMGKISEISLKRYRRGELPRMKGETDEQTS